MPHFIIDCSYQVTKMKPAKDVLQAVHNVADATGLFKTADIKVRINAYTDYLTSGTHSDFIHVFGNIMEGRTQNQKADLSRAIVSKLQSLFPNVPVISMNIRDFEKATYCNLDKLQQSS